MDQQNHAAEQEEERHTAAARRLVAALTRTASPAGRHLDLAELESLVAARLAQGADWEMPEHLLRCPSCLEAFQTLLEGVPAVSAAFLDRCVSLEKESLTTRDERPPKVLYLPANWLVAARLAAVVVAVAGAAWLAQAWWAAGALRLRAGAVTLPGGGILDAGSSVPDGVVLHATQPATTRFRDGSTVELAANTHVSFHRSAGGSVTVRLIRGDVVSTVTPRPPAEAFVVQTPLGQVTVVGTRFRVRCADEAGAPRAGGEAVAVEVEVFEGVVRVKQAAQEARVGPGQRARLQREPRGLVVSAAVDAAP